MRDCLVCGEDWGICGVCFNVEAELSPDLRNRLVGIVLKCGHVVVIATGIRRGQTLSCSEHRSVVLIEAGGVGAPKRTLEIAAHSRSNTIQEGWVEQGGVQTREVFKDGSATFVMQPRAAPYGVLEVNIEFATMRALHVNVLLRFGSRFLIPGGSLLDHSEDACLVA